MATYFLCMQKNLIHIDFLHQFKLLSRNGTMAHIKKELIVAIICYIFRYYNIFGVSDCVYNCEKKKFERNPNVVTYCLLIHILIGIMAPIALFKNYYIPEDDIYFKRPIAMHLGLGLGILNLLTTCVVIVQHWVHHSHTQSLLNGLNDVRVNDLANIRKRDTLERVDARLFVTKLILTAAIVIWSFCATVFMHHSCTDTLMLAGAIFLTFTVNMNIAAQYQFCIGMLYGGYLFKALNTCITQIAEDINALCESFPRCFLLQNACLFSDELTEIGRIHTRLLKLTTGIKDIYQFQILLILIAYFHSQVLTLFYLSMVLTGASFDMNQSQFLITGFGTLICVVDLFVLAFICGDTARACNISGELLRMLTSQNILHAQLEKSIEALALQLAREKMSLSICGLFNLDGNTGYMIAKGAMMKLILLVQIDFDNFYLLFNRS